MHRAAREVPDLRDRGVINDDAMRHGQRDLDPEDLLLEDGAHGL